MNIEIRPADTSAEAAALAALDAKIFLPSDCFEDIEIWQEYEAFWIILDGEIIGSIALGRDLEFSGSWEFDAQCPRCVYLASTGILPEHQRKGIGIWVKQWEIDWARSNGFTRISTHCRKSNFGSLRLNAKFGFVITAEIPGYYEDPDEPTIVMELVL